MKWSLAQWTRSYRVESVSNIPIQLFFCLFISLKFLSSNGPIEPEEYLSDKQVQQQTIGLFGKEIAEEINNFIQQETGITVQD